jgi:large subunit ribosomal protein L24
MHRVRREDTVLVTKGKDRGRTGQVRKVIPKKNRLIVTGVNMVKRHMKPQGQQKPGGIVDREAPIPMSNVALICESCQEPVRVGFRTAGEGRKVRFCKRCDANLD